MGITPRSTLPPSETTHQAIVFDDVSIEFESNPVLDGVSFALKRGETKILLSVPHYDWHWQNWYNLEEPIALPKGTKIDCTAHFDNSPSNPENADPTKEVTWGEQSWDEMMVGFFNLVFDAKMPVENLFPDRKNPAGVASK